MSHVHKITSGRAPSAGSLIFICLILLVIGAEVALRMHGEIPGVLINRFLPVDTVITESRFVADSFGVISNDTSCHCLPPGYTINDQGYRSQINFNDSELDSLRAVKKIVLALGDSYTEGCCATPVDSSFIDQANRSSNDYFILNFGIGSSNPAHYANTLKRYLTIIKPNLVLVNLYLGNDLLPVDIKTPPSIPQTFIIKDFSWLSSTVPHFYQSEVGASNFRTPMEAYDFYVRKFTLLHDDINLIERIISKGVLSSRLFLAIKNGYHVLRWILLEDGFGKDIERTRNLLVGMQNACAIQNTKIHFSLIPSPKNVKHKLNIDEEFDELMQGLAYSHPEISMFSVADYDGMKASDHFNNAGHKKHAQYLTHLLDSICSSNDSLVNY